MIRRGSDTLLFDCGEGAQQQMMRARTGFSVDAIFVTHWHADHFLGIFGLAQTLSFNGRTDLLPVYGPEWACEFLTTLKRISRFHLKFPVKATELAPGDSVRFNGYSVHAFGTSHGLPSLGYVLAEDPRPGRFNRERAIALGVPPGPLFGRLQRGEAVTVMKDGTMSAVNPDAVMGPPRPGRKVVYTGDTRPIPGGMPGIANGADLLIHDATYDETEAGRALEFAHATAQEAGIAACETRARMLALVHLSSRYIDAPKHIADAKRHFDGAVIAPDDLWMIEIPFRG
jgi:ribonuclease Z